MKLKELIVGKKAKFVEFHSETLFYDIEGFRFPVPIYELQGASVKSEEKASVFLRWVKRTLDEINKAGIAPTVEQ